MTEMNTPDNKPDYDKKLCPRFALIKLNEEITAEKVNDYWWEYDRYFYKHDMESLLYKSCDVVSTCRKLKSINFKKPLSSKSLKKIANIFFSNALFEDHLSFYLKEVANKNYPYLKVAQLWRSARCHCNQECNICIQKHIKKENKKRKDTK